MRGMAEKEKNAFGGRARILAVEKGESVKEIIEIFFTVLCLQKGIFYSAKSHEAYQIFRKLKKQSFFACVQFPF
jgi:hypothetical protein